MAGFDIFLTGATLPEDPSTAIGEIRLGEHRETFHAALGFWTPEDYQRSWIEALERLADGASPSCLVTSVTDPAHTRFVVVWPLFRDGESIHVQNRLLFLDQLEHGFDPAAPWLSVSRHEHVDEDGRAISEWRIGVADVQKFLHGRHAD